MNAGFRRWAAPLVAVLALCSCAPGLSAAERERLNLADAPSVTDSDTEASVNRDVRAAQDVLVRAHEMTYEIYSTGDFSGLSELQAIYEPAAAETFVFNAQGMHDFGFTVVDPADAEITSRVLPNTYLQNGVLLLETCRETQGITVHREGQDEPWGLVPIHEIAVMKQGEDQSWRVLEIVQTETPHCPLS